MPVFQFTEYGFSQTSFLDVDWGGGSLCWQDHR